VPNNASRIFNRALPEDEILTMYSVSPLSPEGGQGNRLRE